MTYILQKFTAIIKIVVNNEEPKERRQLLCWKSPQYGGIDLEEFCKAERVSYTKMCHCLGRPSYRNPKDNHNVKV